MLRIQDWSVRMGYSSKNKFITSFLLPYFKVANWNFSLCLRLSWMENWKILEILWTITFTEMFWSQVCSLYVSVLVLSSVLELCSKFAVKEEKSRKDNERHIPKFCESVVMGWLFYSQDSYYLPRQNQVTVAFVFKKRMVHIENWALGWSHLFHQ